MHEPSILKLKKKNQTPFLIPIISIEEFDEILELEVSLFFKNITLSYLLEICI